MTHNNNLHSSHHVKHNIDEKDHAHSANKAHVCKGSETFPISNNNQYMVALFATH